MKPLLRLVEHEDLVQWARSFVDEQFDAWLRGVLWYPRYRPLGKVAGFAFMRDVRR